MQKIDKIEKIDKVDKYDKPEWMALYENFKNNEYGTKILYQELNRLLMDGDVRTDKRWIFEKFKRIMLSESNRALENVRNEGYRIVQPNEHIRLSSREIKRATRRAKEGVNLIVNVAYDLLSDKERAMANLHATRVQGLYISLVGEGKSLSMVEKKFKLPEMPRK